MPPARSTPKVQRWLDLLAALLGRQRAITFEEIAREVPDYTGKAKDSAKRMFERDKRELKAFGVPIESEGAEGENEFRYRLRTTDFYLPYLSLATPRGRTQPAKVDRFGYRSLKSLAFDADELRAVAEGARRAGQLGNAPLAADAASAMRKLACDLPVDGVDAGADVVVVPPRAAADGKVLEALGDALHARKRVRFAYHAQGSDRTSERTVEPYGLFFLGAHWYLVARDVERDALRNFRVSRVRGVKQVAPDKELPEYEIPSDFRLRDHARSRQAWELGDSEAIEVVVELRGESGAARAAAALGAPVEGQENRRRFAVRRQDAFVRWLLSFAGELVPLEPTSIVDEFRREVEATLALYAGAAKSAETTA